MERYGTNSAANQFCLLGVVSLRIKVTAYVPYMSHVVLCCSGSVAEGPFNVGLLFCLANEA